MNMKDILRAGLWAMISALAVTGVLSIVLVIIYVIGYCQYWNMPLF
ncbi:MAG: hypothetical protein IKU29_05070 [Parabacteroides sp.]|nr:hypothetical protein [Parabacteroides sp.]